MLPIVFDATPSVAGSAANTGIGGQGTKKRASCDALQHILSSSSGGADVPGAEPGSTSAAGSRWGKVAAAAAPKAPKASAVVGLKRLASACPIGKDALIGKDVMTPLVALAQSTQTGAEHAVATLLVLQETYPKEVVER